MDAQYTLGNFIFDTPEELLEAEGELKKVRSIYQNYDTSDPKMAAKIVGLYESGDLPFTTSIGLAFIEKMRENMESVPTEDVDDSDEWHDDAETSHDSKDVLEGIRAFFNTVASIPGKIRDKIVDIWYDILLFFEDIKNFWTKTVPNFWTVTVPIFWKEKIIGFICYNKEREILFIIGAVVILAAGVIIPITAHKAFGPKQDQTQIIDLQVSQINGEDSTSGDANKTEAELPSEWVPEIGKYEGKVPDKEYMYEYVNSFLTWTALQYIYSDEPSLQGISIQEAIPMAAYSLCSECMSLYHEGKDNPYWGEYSAKDRTVFLSRSMIEQRCFDLFGIRYSCDDFDVTSSGSGIYPGEDGKYFIFIGTWGEYEPDFEIRAIKGGKIGKDFKVIVRYKKYNVQSGTIDPDYTFSVTYNCTKSDLSKYGFTIEDMSGRRK